MNGNLRRRRLALVGAVVLLLLVFVVVSALAAGVTAAPRAAVRDGPAIVVPSWSAGGAYQLAPRGWQVSGPAAGGAYRLGAVPDDASGCCCKSYLPCAQR